MTETPTNDATQPQGREELRALLFDLLLALAKQEKKPSEIVDAIMSLMPPAGLPVEVNEEALEAARVAFNAFAHGTDEDFVGCLRGALRAALPHAKTEAQVEEALLERLIAEADRESDESESAYDRIRAQRAAEWLRAQEGKSDD